MNFSVMGKLAGQAGKDKLGFIWLLWVSWGPGWLALPVGVAILGAGWLVPLIGAVVVAGWVPPIGAAVVAGWEGADDILGDRGEAQEWGVLDAAKTQRQRQMPS